MTCIVIVVGAGRGSRAGEGLPKQYRTIGGETIVRRCLKAFLAHPDVSAVCPVIHSDDRDLFTQSASGLDVLPVVLGGDTRQSSVFNGLSAIAHLEPDYVLIHDAARPFVSQTMISAVIGALNDYPGAIPALRVVDTLKSSRTGDNQRLIDTTRSRDGLWRAQTPQGFRYGDIMSAHEQCASEPGHSNKHSDDASIAESCGLDVVMVDGDERNIKLTTPADFERAETLFGQLEIQRESQRETRTGMGFDVHRFCPGDHVILCGVDIPHDQSLAGHSDADVAMHALCDALYGCIGGGDIGAHFPPDQEKWRGVASKVFLLHAAQQVLDAGGTISNLDLTIICERPKIGPHREAMQGALAAILGLDASRINIKATTTERLGFTGRAEGIAAQAIATISLPLGD